MGTTKRDAKYDILESQTWGTCENCGTFQLFNPLDLADLYQENHFEPIGPTWEQHHKEFAEFVLEAIGEGGEIVEIGGASGALANLVTSAGQAVSKYTIVEPNYTGPDNRFDVVAGFIEDNLGILPAAKAVIHSHVLEHLYEPMDTLQKIVESMATDSKMVVSFPNLGELLRVGGSNALNFEHTYFLGRNGLVEVLESAGLKLEEFVAFKNHSFFLALEKTGESPRHLDVSKLEVNAEQLFIESWQKIEDVARKFNEAIASDSKNSGYVFGAHVFSQGLFAKGMIETHCKAVLDNSPSKIGQRLYGTNLLVQAPKEIAKVERPVVALMASHYQDEVRSQLKSLNPRVEIIE